MKKLLFVLGMVFLIAAEANALNLDQTCPNNVVCSQSEFLGDDGNCYPCNTPKDIYIHCAGAEKTHQNCPNRVYNDDGLSLFSCLETEEPYKIKDKNYSVCVLKCKKGFRHIDQFTCVNEATKEAYEAMLPIVY